MRGTHSLGRECEADVGSNGDYELYAHLLQVLNIRAIEVLDHATITSHITRSLKGITWQIMTACSSVGNREGRGVWAHLHMSINASNCTALPSLAKISTGLVPETS